MIHHDSSHAYEYIIFDRATMHYGPMADGYIVSNRSSRFLVGAMDDSCVLNIHFIADPDTVDITADDGLEPKTAFIACDHIAGNCCIFSQVAIFSEPGKYSFYRFDQRQNVYFEFVT